MAEDAGTPRTLEALRAELAAASAQVALAAATAVDPWDEVSGDEDDDEAEDGAAERGAEPTEGGESSPDDGTPRSIYDAAEQVDAVGAEGGLERSYSDPSVASVLDPLGALEKPDGQIKTFFMPHTIHKFIEDLQTNEDWSFDEVPMPYDLTLNATGAGTKEVKYSVTPSPKRTPITEAEAEAFIAKKPIREIQAAIYEKQEQNSPDPTRDAPDFDPTEVPM